MTAKSYLFFNGNCAEAMRFYEKALGGKLEILSYAEAPEGSRPECVHPDKVMHACLTAGSTSIMASDDASGAPYKGMNGFAVSLEYPTAGEATRVFEALTAGGQVIMPIGKTFWSEAFGMATDRFGTPWMVSAASAQPK